MRQKGRARGRLCERFGGILVRDVGHETRKRQEEI